MLYVQTYSAECIRTKFNLQVLYDIKILKKLAGKKEWEIYVGMGIVKMSLFAKKEST